MQRKIWYHTIHKALNMSNAGWVGIDLDGTLAEYTEWQGIDHIGPPIAPMLDYVKFLLDMGVDVRIFTARCQEGIKAIRAIEKWCFTHLGRVLPVTATKDFNMVFAIDDRCYTVEINTGTFLVNPPSVAVVKNHWGDGAPPMEEFKND